MAGYDLQTREWPGTYGDAARPRVGFFTDTSVCIGCKACEVACKEWNQIPSSPQGFTGDSYDNTVDLGSLGPVGRSATAVRFFHFETVF